MTNLKTNLVDAVLQTFDSDFPDPRFQEIWSSLEMPVQPQNYPGVWVDYNPSGKLKRAGVGHVEYDSEGGLGREFTRWRFQGMASFTCVALTSLERDDLHDEMVRVLAFGKEFTATSRFRQIIEDNEFIDMNMSFDEIQVSGHADTMGTPWGSDDRVYEVTISMEVLGEFVADSLTFDLAPIDAINVYPYHDMEPDPFESDDGNGAWQ